MSPSGFALQGSGVRIYCDLRKLTRIVTTSDGLFCNNDGIFRIFADGALNNYVMAKYFTDIFGSLAKVVFALLGFSSVTFCDSNSSNERLDEYGTPVADYAVKGTVVDEDSKPISGIRVVRDNIEGKSTDKDTTYTDANGKFSLDYMRTGGIGPDLKFEDIDGEANGGEFATKELVGIDYRQTSERENWYMGKFDADVNVSLEKKK